MFTRGFAAGAVTSVAVYALYSTLVQPEHDEGNAANIRSLPSPTTQDPVTKRLERASEILKYGVPDVGCQPRYYANHALSYNQAGRIPFWVAEHITKEHLQGPASRKLCNFKMDPNMTAMFSSMNSDYLKSGWSRGHMNPAADNKYSQEAMNETFYLTNILPQDINNNMNFWNLIETYCRNLTNRFSEVRVISGPVMMPSEEGDGKQYVKYQVIGGNKVAVPTHLFKVITVERNDSTGEVGVGAFVVPNTGIDPSNHTLREYQVPLDELERCVGVSLLPNLTRSGVQDLCSWDACQLPSNRQLHLPYITGRIRDARTVEQLDRAWAELDSKYIAPDDNLRNLYAERKRAILAGEG